VSVRQPAPRTTCSHCGHQERYSRLILGKPVCLNCAQRFAYRAAICPGCAGVKVLAFYDAHRRAACATCTGNPAIYACVECGREDSPYGRTCGVCTLAERAAELLADPSGRIHPQLQPVFDALVAGPRPRTTLNWFHHSAGPDILRAMARGEIEISHAAFETMASNKTVNYLRDLLVAVGVLPAFDPELERLTPWLADLLAGLPKDHREVLGRFARWHVLRRLRHQEAAGRLTHGAINGARATITATARFLTWLADHDTTITTARQADCDQYAVERPGQAKSVVTFLAWTRRTGLTGDITLPTQPKTQPQVTLADQERWDQVDLLLVDDTIRLYVRIAGLFTLLFAQPLARIVAMRADQVAAHDDGRVAVTFDTVPIALPPPLASLVLTHLARRGQASYASRPDRWLFPGGIPGRHLVTENFRSQLVERGIQPSTARNAAMFQLAGAMPSAVLADILGRAPTTAARWAALAARDWSNYTAQRAAPPTE
jgi:hypothetical protein